MKRMNNKGQAEIAVIIVLGLLFLVGLIVTTAQDTKRPGSFVKTMEPGWVTIEVREDISYDKAWAGVVDLIVRKFEAEILSKENGYLRTTWLYTWMGELREDYRVRVTVKFAPDRIKVDIKSEANYLREGNWIIGSDTAVLQTLKADIMGIVGRVTR